MPLDGTPGSFATPRLSRWPWIDAITRRHVLGNVCVGEILEETDLTQLVLERDLVSAQRFAVLDRRFSKPLPAWQRVDIQPVTITKETQKTVDLDIFGMITPSLSVETQDGNLD